MLLRFIAKGAVNSFYFYDYDRQGWVTNEPAIAKDPMFKPVEPEHITSEEIEALPDGLEKDYQLAMSEPAPAPPEPTLRRRI